MAGAGGRDSGWTLQSFWSIAGKTQSTDTLNSFLLLMGDQMVRYMVLRDSHGDSLAFDPVQHAAALQALSKLIDASNPDISAFRKRGGKLLIMHGTVDLAVTPYNTVAYYEQLKAKFGTSLQHFVRFYMVPGFGTETEVFALAGIPSARLMIG